MRRHGTGLAVQTRKRSTRELQLADHELEATMGYVARLCNKITNLQTSEKVGMGQAFGFSI